jgi:hypothetical protein
MLKPWSIAAVLVLVWLGSRLGPYQGNAQTVPAVCASSPKYYTIVVSPPGTGTQPICVNVIEENLDGTADGANRYFRTSAVPRSGTLQIFRNGLRQQQGLDYGINGRTVSFPMMVPQAGDQLTARYWK